MKAINNINVQSLYCLSLQSLSLSEKWPFRRAENGGPGMKN